MTADSMAETELRRRVGARVKAARESGGLSQEQVAQRVGMARSSIANLEAGRQDMNISRLALVAAAVNLNLADLIQPGDLPELAPLPPAPHEVTVRRVYEVTCETCGGLVIDCHPDRVVALKSKHEHIAAKRDEKG